VGAEWKNKKTGFGKKTAKPFVVMVGATGFDLEIFIF